MLTATSPSRPTFRRQYFQKERSFYLAYGCLLALCFVITKMMDLFDPNYGAGMLALLIVIGITILRPGLGLGLAIVLTLIGDPGTMGWWPASLNLSSSQSILYTADALTIKPLELVLIAVVGVWLVNRRLTPDAPPIIYGALWRPLVVFSVSLVTGMVWGVSRGGDLRVALFESTAMFYIPLVYLAATNLFTKLRHYHKLMTGIMIALLIEAVYGLYRLPEIRARIAEDASPVQHTAVLHMNLMFLMFVGALWFGSRREGKRLWLFLALVPTAILYLDAQRRAGVVGLIIGGIVLTVVLFARNRQKFNRIIPAMLLIVAVYSVGFWNSSSPVAFPAQAVKTVVQPDASNDSDARSDLYRDSENHNLNVTIRTNPLLGIGFGRAFLQPIPLPDISFFEFADYIAHNSVLWMWAKIGFAGFVSYLYMIALGTAAGVRAAVRSRDPDDATLYAVLTAYLPMSLVVAFVEISFEPQTTLLIGLAMAFTGSCERFVNEAEAEEQELLEEGSASEISNTSPNPDDGKPIQDGPGGTTRPSTRALESV